MLNLRLRRRLCAAARVLHFDGDGAVRATPLRTLFVERRMMAIGHENNLHAAVQAVAPSHSAGDGQCTSCATYDLARYGRNMATTNETDAKICRLHSAIACGSSSLDVCIRILRSASVCCFRHQY